MTITYAGLMDTMFSTAQKNGLEEITDESEQKAIESIVSSIEYILGMSVLIQTKGSDTIEHGGEFSFPPNTKLERDTLEFIYQEVGEMSNQLIYMSLIKDILSQDEQLMLNAIIDKYNNLDDDGFLAYINALNLKELMTEGIVIFGIVSLVKSGDHLMTAIKETLIEYGLDPYKNEVRNSIALPEEIQNFLHEFNQIILSNIHPNSKSMLISGLSCALN